MYDIPELEKKWKKYKRSKIKKPLIISTSFVLIGVGVYFAAVYYVNSNKRVSIAEKNITATSVSKASNSNKTSSSNVVNNKQDNNSLISINKTSSSNSTQDDGIDLSKAIIIKPNVPDDEIRVIGFNKNEKKDIENKYSDILLPNKSASDIAQKERIAELKDKFKETNDAQDSLELAKYYYRIKKYKKAEDWAVNTNNLDGDLEDSWLIFAKARLKQGFRKDAIKVLQSFYDETNSIKAKKLLDVIRRGKKVD